MNGIDLDAIKARCAACQPGPWESRVCRDEGTPYEAWGVQEVSERGVAGGWIVSMAYKSETEFIAHARTDVPLLVAEIERLRSALEQKLDLVRYSMRFFADDKDQEEAARTALSGLLMMAARAVENGEPENLAEYSEITITLRKKRWDRRFVFELKAIG